MASLEEAFIVIEEVKGHNNMQKFTTLRNDNIRNDLDKPGMILDIFSGANETKLTKTELDQTKMFKPTIGLTHINGTPNYNYEIDRLQKNLHRGQKGILPFQPIREPPGLGGDYNEDMDPGFHDSFRVKPKNRDTLRTKNNDKGKLYNFILAPPTRMATSATQVKSNMFKNRPETTFKKSCNDLFTTTGVEVGPARREKYYLKEDNLRNMTLQSYIGHASSSTTKNNYVCMEETENKRQQLPQDPVTNAIGKSKGSNNQKSYNLGYNNRQSTSKLGITNAKGGTAYTSKPQDNMKSTMRQTTESKSLIGNMINNIASYVYDASEQLATTLRNTLGSEPPINPVTSEKAQSLHLSDRPKITSRNTVNHDNVINASTNDKSYVQIPDEIKLTKRNTLPQETSKTNVKSYKITTKLLFKTLQKTTKSQTIGKARNKNIQGQIGYIIKPSDNWNTTKREITEV